MRIYDPGTYNFGIESYLNNVYQENNARRLFSCQSKMASYISVSLEFLRGMNSVRSKTVSLNPVVLEDTIGITSTEEAPGESSPRPRENEPRA